MLRYCIERLKHYNFQNAPDYDDDNFDSTFQFLRTRVIDLLHEESCSKKATKRVDYLNQLSDFLDKLNIYNSKENHKNMQYIGLMITLLHYNSQQDSLMSSMSIIDYCN